MAQRNVGTGILRQALQGLHAVSARPHTAGADHLFWQTPACNHFEVLQIDETSWQAGFTQHQQARAAGVLEAGGLILLPRLSFPLADAERPLLGPDCVKHGSKHVSFDLHTGLLRGASTQADEAGTLRQMLGRYARASLALVRALFPHYVRALEVARTSFRPIEASGRTGSWRKDDRRLHVDAFPSTPNQGRRLLRVFSNVNPEGRDRVWNIGEPFETVARRFQPDVSRRWPGYARLLCTLGITRGLRTEYDQVMLQLHDRMKADVGYQAGAVSRRLSLPAGSTWIVQTDSVSHAALSGQFMLEQTFLLPVSGMVDPGRSPLRILERLLGRPLA
jgi:3-deoxy-D-manno-oct-2-ulosonic acid (Kdo) hydroxylase